MSEVTITIPCRVCGNSITIIQGKTTVFSCPGCHQKFSHCNGILGRYHRPQQIHEEKFDFISHKITVKTYEIFCLFILELSPSFYAELLNMLPAGDFDAERHALNKILLTIHEPSIMGAHIFDSAGSFYEVMQELEVNIPNTNNNFWFKTILAFRNINWHDDPVRQWMYTRNSAFSKKMTGKDLPYNNDFPTYTHIGGIYRNDYAYCSDNSCPCPNVILMRDEGYIYIEETDYGHYKAFKGIVVCETGAKRRKLDLESAHKDALHWWKTGDIPNRPSLTNYSVQEPPVRQTLSDNQMEELQRQRTKEFNDRAFYMQFGCVPENLVVFVDIETSGLPRRRDATILELSNWPYIVQIAWQIYTPSGVLVSKTERLVKPLNFTIEVGAFQVHGISAERAHNDGILCAEALKQFNNAIKNARYIIGHNIEFDLKIIQVELRRNGLTHDIQTKKVFCTMLQSVIYCNLITFRGLKNPSLKELYFKVFNNDFEHAHDASADIQATADCFWELKERGVFVLN